MIAVGILLVLVVLLGLTLVWFVSYRRTVPDMANPDVLSKSRWGKYQDIFLPGIHWLEQQKAEPLQVMSYDGKILYGRFVPCENAKGTLILFHGYRSSYVIDFSAALSYYHSLGYNLLICDQRAHGKSQGRFITFGVRERYDVLSWVTYLSLKLGEEHPLFLLGLSMGATTVLMASDLDFPGNVRGILADCGFTSPGDIIRYLLKNHYHLPPKLTAGFLNVFTRIFAGFGLDQWSTEAALSRTHLPVLLFHGLEDHFVPPEMSRRAYAACAGEKTLEEFPGANHGVSYLKDTPRYQKAVETFLEKHREL